MKLGAYNKRGRVNLKFGLADFVYLIQEHKSNYLRLSNKYAGVAMSSARPLNHVYKIRHREDLNYPSSFFLTLSSLGGLESAP